MNTIHHLCMKELLTCCTGGSEACDIPFYKVDERIYMFVKLEINHVTC